MNLWQRMSETTMKGESRQERGLKKERKNIE